MVDREAAGVPPWTIVPEPGGGEPSPGPSLLETDRIYFELGAERRELPGARLVWLEGLTDLPAAGVVHRVDPDVIDPEILQDWPEVVADAHRAVGLHLGRVYLDEPAPALEAALAAAGWEARDEVGFAALTPIDPRHRDGLVSEPVVDDADWAAKLALHETCDIGPDGHDAPASEWLAMERVRCATGVMDMWLFRRDGTVVGTVGSLTIGQVRRNKNVVVHPDHRRSNVGLGILAHLDALAREAGRMVGTFAVLGGAGEALYRAAGMQPVVVQREWSRVL